MNTLTLAYQLAQKSNKFEAARLERARQLLSDPRTVILPSNEIDFPSDSEGFRVLPLVQDGKVKFCDCPDHFKSHYCKHDIARMLLYRATTIRHTGRIIIA